MICTNMVVQLFNIYERMSFVHRRFIAYYLAVVCPPHKESIWYLEFIASLHMINMLFHESNSYIYICIYVSYMFHIYKCANLFRTHVFFHRKCAFDRQSFYCTQQARLPRRCFCYPKAVPTRKTHE